MATKTKAVSRKSNHSRQPQKSIASPNGLPKGKPPAPQVNQYGIPDWRLEKPEFEVIEVSQGDEVHYEIRGKLDIPVPPIRDSQYLNKQQCLELYRWMVLNRRMEQKLENLYKQGSV